MDTLSTTGMSMAQLAIMGVCAGAAPPSWLWREPTVDEEQKKTKRRLPSVFYNMTSIVGAGLASLAFGLIVFLFILEHYSPQPHPYMGLITFLIMPVFIVLGLVLAVVGVWRNHRRVKRGEAAGRLPKIDFAIPRHRFAVTMIAIAGFGFMGASTFGTYEAFEYTESVEFCGLVCHTAMEPEYTAYKESPHARVKCAQCHIGSGADWFVKAKISGSYQVYSYLFDKFHRPIPTPIRNLRPAKETCEQCHWPSHFYSQKLVDRTFFLSDETNSRSELTMVMKIGGREQGVSQGIHAHMYLDTQVNYIATDSERMIIPYVETRSKDGTITTYRSTEVPFTDEQVKKASKRTVDCIDCHNRPSHVFRNPAQSVNLAMSRGWIDPSLPEIKRVAVEELEKPYKSQEAAGAALKVSIAGFYKESYPEISISKAKLIEAAIKQLQIIYNQNYFPTMKVSWKAYPDHKDHLYSTGCFRCHDGKHVSPKGKVISKDCNSCHSIVSQKGPDGKREVSMQGLEFKHPVDVGDAWKTTLCKDCHAPD